MVNQDYNIIIGGVRKNILSYETLLRLEPGNIESGEEPLKVSEYLSMLFSNLGYNGYPQDLSFIANGIPIENVIKNNVLDYRMTNRILTVNPNGTTLYEMLEIIRYWCRGTIEQGTLLDLSKSFVLPSQKEIEYNLNNGIDIKRKAFVTKEATQWDTSNIWTRRLHNINPNINGYYYSHCIRNFSEYAKQIIVQYPHAVFAASIIDPDILMSIIRNCEIKAAEIADKKWYANYSAIRRDYDTVIEFIPLFNSQISHVNNIYMTSGAFGFVPQVNTNIDPVEMVQKIETAMNLPENQTSMTPEMIKKDIDDMKLTGDDIAYIYNYVLKKSMPEFISKQIKTNREQLEYNTMYEPFMKHLKWLLDELMKIAPNIMSSKDKFILSRPFFLGPDAFGLYLKSENLYVLLTPDMRILPGVPRQAVMYYKQLYNKDIRLDPDEIEDSLESSECKDVDLAKLDSSIVTDNNIVIPSTSINNIDYNPSILDTSIPIQTTQEEPKEEYSLSKSALVEE